MRANGYAVDALGLARIENGRKLEIDIDFLIGAAYALDVSPLALLLPAESDEIETPERALIAAQLPPVGHYGLRAWLRGQTPLPGQDGAEFYRARSSDEVLERELEQAAVLEAQAEAEAAVDAMSDVDVLAEVAAERGIDLDELPQDRRSLELLRSELILRWRASAMRRRASRTARPGAHPGPNLNPKEQQ